MSKWETQGRINLITPSAEVDSLCLETRFLRSPCCCSAALQAPSFPLPASRRGGSSGHKNLTRYVKFKPQFQCDDGCLLADPNWAFYLIHRRKPNFCLGGTKGFSKKKRCRTTGETLAQVFRQRPESQQSPWLPPARSRVQCIDG